MTKSNSGSVNTVREKPLFVFDVDQTLLISVAFTQTDHRAYIPNLRAGLKEHFNAVDYGHNRDILIAPRPHLQTLVAFLAKNQERFGVGIYSAASRDYLDTVLQKVAPWFLDNTVFIWSAEHCYYYRLATWKLINNVSSEFGYPLDRIFIFDDLPYVEPLSCHIPVEPFWGVNDEQSKDDKELLRLIEGMSKTCDGNSVAHAVTQSTHRR